MLTVIPSSGTLDNNEVLTLGTTPTSLIVNGILPAYMATQNSGGDTSLDFLTVNGSKHVVPATAVYASSLTAGPTAVVALNGGGSVGPGTTQVFGLKVAGGSVTGNGTLLVGDGTNPGGIILDSSASIQTSNLSFGANEGIIWAGGGDASVSSAISLNTTLTTAGGSQLNFSGALTFNPGSNVNVNGSTVSISGTIAAGNLIKQGPGILVISGDETPFSGSFTSNSGVLQIGDGNTSGTLNSNSKLTSNASIAFNRSDSVTIGNSISGTGNIVQSGTGATTLTGNLSYSGNTVVNNGTLRTSGTTLLPANSSLLSNGGTFDLNGLNQTIIGVNSGATAGTINSSVFGNATLTLTGSGSFNGVIANGAGTVNLVKNTGGNEILNGISTYSGTTILSGGTLTLNGITNQSGAFTNAVAGTGTIIFNGGYLSNGADPANTLTVANRLSVPAGNVGTIIMGNRIALGSNATGTLTGGGVLNMVISSNVTRDDIKGDFGLFTGTVNLYGNGTARVGQNFGNASRSVFNMPSGWLELNDSVNLSPQDNSGGNAYPIGALSSSSPNAVIQLPGAGGVGSLQVGLLNKDSTFAGSIQGNNSLAKLGTGKLVLTGNNSFTNATIVGTDSSTLPGVPGGSLVIGSGGNLSGTTAITVNDGATFAMAGTGTLTSVATLSLRATGAFDVTSEPGWSTPKGLTVTGSNIVGAQPKIFSSGHYLHNAGTINPGAVGGAGTMNFQNGLDLHGGIAALDLSGAGAGANQTMLGGGFNDLIDVSNGLSITPSSLRINFINGTPTTGSVYPIARYDSLTDGNGVPITTSGTLNGWDILGAAAGNYILQNDNANKELTLTFTTNPNFTTQDLIWTGTTSGVWETGTSNNWKDSTTSVASPFFLGDSVNFLDQGGVTTITLNAVMSPSKVTVNSDNLNYAFIGSGGIAGTGALIKDGAGTLILGNTTSSSYSGGTFLKKGTIDLNAAGVLVNTTTLGSGPIHMSDQTTLIGSGLLSDTSQPDIPQAIILDAGQMRRSTLRSAADWAERSASLGAAAPH